MRLHVVHSRVEVFRRSEADLTGVTEIALISPRHARRGAIRRRGSADHLVCLGEEAAGMLRLRASAASLLLSRRGKIRNATVVPCQELLRGAYAPGRRVRVACQLPAKHSPRPGISLDTPPPPGITCSYIPLKSVRACSFWYIPQQARSTGGSDAAGVFPS
jgi:hypothetical protein